MKIKKYKSQKGLINAVHKLLSDKERWTQGTDAEDKDHTAVDFNDPNAERFCVRGALKACAADSDLFHNVYNCLNQISARDWRISVLGINDHEGHEAVMELLEKGKSECK